MRASTLFAALLSTALLAACKGDDGESSTTGSEPHCTAGWGDGPDVDPNFPACGCLPERCESGSSCAADGLGESSWESSVCLPPCKTDSECPTLGGVATKCEFDFCRLACDNDATCPAGYVCSEGGECQVKLE